MGRGPDPCLNCGKDTRREADETYGCFQKWFRCKWCNCNGHFCLACTKYIDDGLLTKCPKCEAEIPNVRLMSSDLEEAAPP